MQNKEQIYKMIFDGKALAVEEILLSMPNYSPCLLSLAYLIQNKIQSAEQILRTVIQPDLDLIDQLAYEESSMILSFKNIQSVAALAQAQKIIEAYPNASFARYFLARNARKQRSWGKALDHYEKLVAIYPDNDSLLLDVAEVMVFLKKSALALDYVIRAKPSARQRSYKILIPLIGTTLSRLIIFLIVLGFVLVVDINNYTSIGFMILTAILCWIARKDLLISFGFLYLGIVWLLSLWIRSLM